MVGPTFWADLEGAITARPTEMVSLFASHPRGNKLSTAWYRTHDGLIGNGYVLPMPMLKSFLDWRDEAVDPSYLTVLSEDQLLNLYTMWTGADILHTNPSLVQHDEEVGSCFGNGPVKAKYGPPPASWETDAPHVGRMFNGNHWFLSLALRPGYRKPLRAYEIARAPW